MQANAHRYQLVELQQRRLRQEELGQAVGSLWQVYPPGPERDNMLMQAADAYRAAGNSRAELRVLEPARCTAAIPIAFSNCCSKGSPSGWWRWRRRCRAGAARPSGEHGAGGQRCRVGACASSRREGSNLPPVWTRAYSGLVGLYFGSPGCRRGQRVSGARSARERSASGSAYAAGSRSATCRRHLVLLRFALRRVSRV